MPRIKRSIGRAVSEPPALCANGGIAVPADPLAMTRRIEASSMIARYTGLFIAIAAPDLPSAPWHPAQLSPYRVAKSVTLVGRSGRSACVGRPGSRSHPPSRLADSDALTRSDVNLHAFNL